MKILKIKELINFISKRKYIITGIIFLIWIIIIDQNSILARVKNTKNLNNLKYEKEFYKQKINDDSTKLYQLKTDNNNLEKFAREQYLMHKSNEDIFVFVK